MLDDERRRLYNLKPDSSAYNFRLEKVHREIQTGASQFEQRLCASAGITLDRLHELLESHTIGTLNVAITRGGSVFESYLGRPGSDKPEDPRAPGWHAKWEWEKEEREERREREKRGGEIQG